MGGRITVRTMGTAHSVFIVKPTCTLTVSCVAHAKLAVAAEFLYQVVAVGLVAVGKVVVGKVEVEVEDVTLLEIVHTVLRVR